MELSLVRLSGLNSLQSLQASTSGVWPVARSRSRQRCAGCSSGLTFSNLRLGNCRVSAWRRRPGSSGTGERPVTSCQASGGTRRDQAKNVARTQKRRARHVKGVNPTKPELFDELRAEEEADEILDRFEADNELYTSDEPEDFDRASGGDLPTQERQGLESDFSGASFAKPVGNTNVSNKDENVDDERWDQNSLTSSEEFTEIVNNGEDTYTVKFFPEGKKPRGGIPVDDIAKDSTRETQETTDSVSTDVTETLEDLRENVEDVIQDAAELSSDVSDIAQDTTEDVVGTVQEAAEESGSEAGTIFGENIEQGTEEITSVVEEVAGIAQTTAQDVERIAEETVEESRKSFEEVESAFQDSLEEIGNLGEEVVEQGANVLSELLQEGQEAVGLNGSGARQAVKEKPEMEGRSVRSKETEEPKKQESRSNKKKSSQYDESIEIDKDLFKGLKVAVAGASGRTGRYVVEELVRKGVPVKALVRDTNKFEARDIAKLKNVEVVQADLYKYEAVRKALGDSNVVICTIGARSFPFDPIGTYQAEYEGVKNLVAAAKNKSDIKKFVHVSTLGVTFLQIVPLIFWKKQAELDLQRSGINYTIVRPGGLNNGSGKRGVLFNAADTQFGGGISRRKVAEICVAALVTPEASEKIVEVVSTDGISKSYSELFSSV